VESGNASTRADMGPRVPYALAQKDTYFVTMKSFANLGLSEPLCRALAVQGYAAPTPIQAQSIPPLLAGRDVLGIAQTGTGKTAAFVLPLLQHLSSNRAQPGRRSARSLILVPTRELAIQIGDSVRAYGRHITLRHAILLGGVGQGPQVKALARGVDILIATPGRLLDLVAQGHLRIDGVSHLVLDEADRMLDMGFIRDVRKIIAGLPIDRQSLLFSATMPPDIARLAAEVLDDPVRIDVSPAAVTVDSIDQRVHFVDAKSKRAFLTELLSDRKLARVLVFTRTKHGANKVADHLGKAGISADAMHGNKSQSARQRALDGFRSGRTRVLVATDVAARGIDVDDVTHVVNYEIPNVPESYVHRIGRTARAGAAGTALSFCDPSEHGYLRDIERLIDRSLVVVGPHPATHEVRSATPAKASPSQKRNSSARLGRRRRGGQRRAA
jgi:ATP-dependent RNA helicase RhlE